MSRVGAPTRTVLKWRDARRRVETACLFQLRSRSRPPILWYAPNVPPIATSILRIVSAELGMRLLPAAGQEHPTIVWDTGTVYSQGYPSHALNAACDDISKTTVERTFSLVFGYGYAVDPTKHSGLMVEKSNENATHDGRIVQAPIATARDGFVYNRLIDNRVSPSLVEDIRVPIILGRIPFVYLKQRPLAIRFSNENSSASIHDTDRILTAEEQANLVRFATAMKMQFGELDVLRDSADRRIYVVDANRTPAGPPNHLPWRDGYRAVQMIAACIRETWITPATASGS